MLILANHCCAVVDYDRDTSVELGIDYYRSIRLEYYLALRYLLDLNFNADFHVQPPPRLSNNFDLTLYFTLSPFETIEIHDEPTRLLIRLQLENR